MKCAALLLMVAMTACPSKEYAETAVDGVKRANDVARLAATRSDPSVAEEELGVDECDAYLRDVRSCITGNVSAAAQAPARAQVDGQAKTWRVMAAADPAQKAGLPEQCSAAREVAAASYASYGRSL